MIYRFLIISLFLVIISSCGGTHGAIEHYHFEVSKDTLNNQIKEIVESSENLSFQETDMGVDYFEIIVKGDENCHFIFRYYGDEDLWKKSKNSEIFIAYIKFGNDKYLTDNKILNEDKEKALEIIEKNFISRLGHVPKGTKE